MLRRSSGEPDDYSAQMRVLINALSATHMSAQHVVRGHVRQLAGWTLGEHEYVVLHDQQACLAFRSSNVVCTQPRIATRHWAARRPWEEIALPRLVRDWNIDVVLMMSGTVVSRCPVPQASLAQSPWCLVDDIGRSPAEHIKASLQRVAYREAMRRASLMAYASEHMRAAYRRNAGGSSGAPAAIVYNGIDSETFDAADALCSVVHRKPFQILAVSAMAPWKGIETLLRATRVLRDGGVPAQVALVGPWPNRQYEATIDRLTDVLALKPFVRKTGYVDRATLHRYYAESRVFCLMSKCEGFGIPAVEAQAFGTPVVASDCSGIAEICRVGGLFGPSDKPREIADLLASLLVDNALWRCLSERARTNAWRYRWEDCSRPLLRIFELD